MKNSFNAFLMALACTCAVPVAAEDAVDFGSERPSELAAYIQCAPYARQVSGIQIFGDARSWWEQAQGRYATGTTPQEGAVMAFIPHRNMVLGHVAVISGVIDSRHVLLDHANWSPIDGRRGQVEKDVLAIDVSPANDWSQVRVWYAPLGAPGATAWPVAGFIYAEKVRGAEPVRIAQTRAGGPSKDFNQAFANFR